MKTYLRAYSILLIICCFNFCNCQKQTDLGSIEINKFVLLWKTQLGTSIMEGEATPIVTNDDVVFYYHNNKTQYVFLDKITGIKKFLWDDLYNKERYAISGKPYFSNNILSIADLYGSYGINTKTYQTSWRNESVFDVDDDGIGWNNNFFYTEIPAESKDNGAGHGTMVMVDMLYGNRKNLFNLNTFQDSALTFISSFFYVTNNLIYLTYQDATTIINKKYHDSDFFYKVFNITQNKFIDSLCIDKYGGLGQVEVNDSKVYYNTPFHFVCMDEATHKVYWQKDFFSMAMGTKGFTLDKENSIIYASIQNIEPPLGFFLKAIDANTGVVLWQTNIGNHCTKPLVMNGVVYTTVNSLLAFDTRTGADIFRVSASSLNPDDKSDFDSHNVVGDGENIYLSSGMYAYCIKGVK